MQGFFRQLIGPDPEPLWATDSNPRHTSDAAKNAGTYLVGVEN
jgi:hypothetical protein